MRSGWQKGCLMAAGIAMARCLAGEPEWPQWRGPRRDDVSTETGLLRQWPAAGPRLIWTATDCGRGYSSVALSGQMIYTAGIVDKQTYVVAFDLAGNRMWKTANGPAWKASAEMKWAVSYDGARATPTVADGLVYHLNDTGLLSAFAAGSGQTVWSVDILQRFEAKCPDYGHTESVLVDGDRLICYPGGKKGYMVALDKRTGATVWANTDIGDEAGFASAILVEDQGLRQIVSRFEVPKGGDGLFWAHPVVCGGRLYIRHADRLYAYDIAAR